MIVLAKHSVRDFWTLGIALATFLILTKWKIPEPIIIVLVGGWVWRCVFNNILCLSCFLVSRGAAELLLR